MNLFKTSFLNGIAVSVRLASALFLNKIMAVYVGPAGYAIIGQFQNVVSIVVSLAGGLIATGVTKATAQHYDDEQRQHIVWKTAIRFSLVASVITGFVLIFIGNVLSEWLLHRADMSSVFIWLAITLPALAVNNLLLTIVNGKKEVGIYVKANVIASLLAVLVSGLLVINFGLYGALIAFTVNPAIGLLSTGLLISRRRWFKVRFLWGAMERSALRELAGFGLMGLTSALTLPVTFMSIRDHLATKLGLAAAGYWQASWKISEIYLMLVTATLSVYYLPRLSEIRTARDLKAEIIKVYCFVLPIASVSAAMIWFSRDFIIHILFTKDFSPMRILFPWQLTGDVIKIGSWILSHVMLGRAMVKCYVITEISFCLSFFILTCLFVREWGLQGVAIAYAANYALYWICMGYLVTREMQQMKLSLP